MSKLDIYAKAEIGESLAGFTLGEKLQNFLHYVDKTVDGNIEEWTVDLALDNPGVLLYEIPNTNGYTIYFSKPKLELGFTEKGTLCVIIAGAGYKGDIFEGNVKIGSRIADIARSLVLDDTEDVHYLMDGDGEVIHGIYFVADGLEVDDDPDQKIQEVRVYNYSIE